MATRARAVEPDETELEMIPANPDETQELTELDKEEMSFIDRVRSVVRGVPSDRHRLRIYRVGKGPGTMAQCDEMRPEEFDTLDFHTMYQRWGAGEFEVRLFGDKGLITRGRMKLDAPPQSLAVASTSQAPRGTDLSELLIAMREQNQQLVVAMKDKPDSNAQMMQMLTMAKLMREAFGPSDKPSAPAIDPMALVREVMGTVREMKSVAKELKEGDEPEPAEDSLLGIVRSMAPVLQSAISGQQAQQQPQNAPFPALQMPASIEHARAHQSENPNPTENEKMSKAPAPQSAEQLLLLGIIEDMCDMAKAGKSHTEGAEFALDELPDDAIPVLKNRYGIQVLLQNFPVAQPHKAWFEGVRLEAIRLINLPDPGEPDADGNTAG